MFVCCTLQLLRNSILYGSTTTVGSHADYELRQVFTLVGSYRNQIVAIKNLEKKTVDLTRSVRKELKIVRTLNLAIVP